MKFKGPLFIVGLPRSGTKLLRDLLNQNPAIGIPVSETNFIPAITRMFNYKPPKTKEELKKFFETFTKVNFYYKMKNEGICLQEDDFISIVKEYSWEGIFEVLLKYYSRKDEGAIKIYGDKSPSYLHYIDILNRLFPNAKFIHIIRDPRDYCLSINNIWKKNIFRAANNWQHEIAQAKHVTRGWKNYYEIIYEELIQSPQTSLTAICDYLDCSFNENMLSLSKPAENYGDAKNDKAILQTNSGKYSKKFSKEQIKRIEEIVFTVQQKMHYPVHYANKQVRLTNWELFWYRLSDIYNLISFHTKEKGVIKGLKFLKRGFQFKT